jgi:drug/metabolite transporter (DMT)-like permease
MGNSTKAYLCGLGAVGLWSTVASAFKISLRYLEPLQLLLYSSIASFFVLSAIVIFQGKGREVFRCTPEQYFRSFVLGLLNPFLYYVVLFKAYDLLPAQEAQPINYTWAITLSLLSVPLLGHKLRARDIVALFVSYAGVLVLSTHGDVFGFRFTDPLGVGLALSSTVIWSLFWIYNTKAKVDAAVGLLLNFAFGLPFVFAACAIFSKFYVSDMRGLLGAGYVGAFEMGIAFVLWLYALKLTDNTARVANLIFISPFLSLVFIHYLVGEEILPSTFVGLSLIVAGLIIQKFRSGGKAGS